jgi:adenine-specific DNA-methyltransferase
MAKPINSLKHNNSTRPLTPSSEEAGMEGSRRPTVRDYSLNPIVHRGQDPELMWMHKYGEDNAQEAESVDIRSLYRHEHIRPEHLISALARQKGQHEIPSLFGNEYNIDELEKPTAYYNHQNAWENRLIQGDSLLVMTSLLEREGYAGKVQCIYIDPPYGIKYGSNWQMQLNKRDVKDGSDEHLTSEPEMIKAYRDTWELGIHSYLSYLRSRLLAARELLTESGSCFVQISDENVHLVRCLMDEVFGSENFINQIPFQKSGGMEATFTSNVVDYLIWYGKNKAFPTKYRQLYTDKTENQKLIQHYHHDDGDGRKYRLSQLIVKMQTQQELLILNIGAKNTILEKIVTGVSSLQRFQSYWIKGY